MRTVAQGKITATPYSLRIQSNHISGLSNELLYKSVPQGILELSEVKFKTNIFVSQCTHHIKLSLQSNLLESKKIFALALT